MAIDSDRTIRLIAEIWSSAIHQVLNQKSGSNVEIAPRDRSEERESARQGWKDAAWFCFEATSFLKGGHAFAIPLTDAASLADRFNGETAEAPLDASIDNSSDDKESLGEMFVQVASHVSQALSQKLGSQIDFAFKGQSASAWEPYEFQLFRCKQSNKDRALISLVLSEEFIRSLDAILGPSANGEVPQRVDPSKARKAPLGEAPENIALFLDLELEATLRFGTREMAICEVLELNTGSIVELDKMVNEPVELLVCGKVIARGEVVVVDNKYALRVTEVLSHSERVRSLVS